MAMDGLSRWGQLVGYVEASMLKGGVRSGNGVEGSNHGGGTAGEAGQSGAGLSGVGRSGVGRSGAGLSGAGRSGKGRRGRGTWLTGAMVALMAGGLGVGVSARADSGTGSTVSVNGTQVYNGGQVSPGSSYTRMVRLQYGSAATNGRIIATFEDFDAQAFPIYESDDDGVSWHQITTVSEQHLDSSWKFEWQPDLYELAQPLNDLPAGTLLLAGNSIGNGQQIELYTSTDQGHTWHFRSTIVNNTGAAGGKGVWEPNLQVAADGNLVVYYSDETMSPTYSQAISEVWSSDGGLTWTPKTVITEVTPSGQRPGMPVTAKLPDGRYVMSTESVGQPGNQVHIKYSSDGKNWGDPTSYGTPIQTASGAFLGATPYIRWAPTGGVKGTLFVSAQILTNSGNTDRELMMSTDLGSTWTLMAAPEQWQGGANCDHAGWSSSMLPTADGAGLIEMAASFQNGCHNEVRVAREQLLVPNQTYVFVNQNSGQAVDIPQGQSTLSLPLEQWTVNGNPAQNWTVQDIGNGTFTMINPQDNEAWDDPQGGSVQGGPVEQYSQTHVTAQQWKPLPVGNGYLRLQNAASGLVMAVNNQSQTAGAAVTQWIDNGTPDHNWRPSQGVVANGTYKIVATTTGNVLDGENNSNAAGNPIDIWTYWHGPNQRWYIQSLNNGYYSIQTINGNGTLGTFLENRGCNGADGNAIDLASSNTGACQQWAITAVSSGAFKISSAQAKADGTHDVLDGATCSGAAGKAVDLWTDDGGSCQQQWSIQAAY